MMKIRGSIRFDLKFRAVFLFLLLLTLLPLGRPADAGEVTLAWDPNTEPELAGYRVYYGNSSGDYSTTVDVGNTTITTVDELVVGQTYYFAATAYDTEGLESDFSNEVFYTVPGDGLTYTIVAAAGDGGTIAPAGAVAVSAGGTQDFIITPETDYHIPEVKVDGESVGAVKSYTFSDVTADHTISVYFTATKHIITAAAGSGGSISPAGAVLVDVGSSQTFTITPQAGYHIADVKVDGESVGAVKSYTFNKVTAKHTISAVFAVNSYAITASAGSNGTITPSGSVIVAEGGTQSFTIKPAGGYRVADVLVDGKSVGAVGSYTFNKVTSKHTISASFKQADPEQDSDGDGIPDQWELTYGLDPHADDASGDPDGDGISNLHEYLGGTDPNQFDANRAPHAPELVFPADDDLVALVVTLETDEFYDPDYGDSHSATQWRIIRESDGVCVFDLQSSSALTAITVPKLILDEQTGYSWQVRFFDNHAAASEWSLSGYFTTRENRDDLNGNGIPDSQEVDLTADVDGDGTFDVDQIGIKSIRAQDRDTMIAVDTKNSPNVLELVSLLSENPDDPEAFPETEGKPAPMPFGLINLKVLVENPADQTTLTVYFSETVSADSIWYKYDSVNGTWDDFSDYVEFSPGGKSLTLYLEDGGPGDADGVANGIIVDPSGLMTELDDGAELSSGGDNGGSGSQDGLKNMASCFISSAAQQKTGQSRSSLWQEIRGRELALLFVLAVCACALQRLRRGR